MPYSQPLPTFTSLADLWGEMAGSSPTETLGEFMNRLVLRERQYRDGRGNMIDAVYLIDNLLTCDECGALELDRPITSGLCEECYSRMEWEAEADAAHISGLRLGHFSHASLGVR